MMLQRFAFLHMIVSNFDPEPKERVFSGLWDATTIPRVRPFEV